MKIFQQVSMLRVAKIKFIKTQYNTVLNITCRISIHSDTFYLNNPKRYAMQKDIDTV